MQERGIKKPDLVSRIAFWLCTFRQFGLVTLVEAVQLGVRRSGILELVWVGRELVDDTGLKLDFWLELEFIRTPDELNRQRASFEAAKIVRHAMSHCTGARSRDYQLAGGEDLLYKRLDHFVLHLEVPWFHHAIFEPVFTQSLAQQRAQHNNGVETPRLLPRECCHSQHLQ